MLNWLPGHAHGEHGEEEEEGVGEGKGAQAVAEHLAHLMLDREEGDDDG